MGFGANSSDLSILVECYLPGIYVRQSKSLGMKKERTSLQPNRFSKRGLPQKHFAQKPVVMTLATRVQGFLFSLDAKAYDIPRIEKTRSLFLLKKHLLPR